jgi:hypothetical protein
MGISAHFKIGRLKSSRFFAGASLKTGAWIQNYGQGLAGKGASILAKVVNIHGSESIAMASSLFGHQHWLPVSRF